MTLTVLAPPAGSVLPLAEAKDYLRLGHDGEDELVADLTDAAVARVEVEAGVALLTRTLRLTLVDWPRLFAQRGLRLRPAPVSALIEARVASGDGPQDVTSRLRFVAGQLCPRRWSYLPAIPIDGALEVDFTAGFGAAGDVPDDLKLAVKRTLAAAYGARDTAVGTPDAVEQLLAPYREARL